MRPFAMLPGRLDKVSGEEETEAVPQPLAGCFFLKADLMLSHNSIFTPLRFMIMACWLTESVLFHAQ